MGRKLFSYEFRKVIMWFRIEDPTEYNNIALGIIILYTTIVVNLSII